MAEVSLPVVLLAAAVDSLNPCAFGVLILLMTYFLVAFKSKIRVLMVASIYITIVYITYLLLGIGVLTAASLIGFGHLLYYTIAFVVIAGGILEVKDYFFYGRWLSLSVPQAGLRMLENIAMKASIPSAFILGILVALIEFPCTGAPYLAILALLQTAAYAQAVSFLLVYNLVFVAPLIVLTALIYWGEKTHRLEVWRREHRGLMRLATGILLLSLGVWIITIVA